MTATIWLLSAVSFVVVAIMTVSVPLLPVLAAEFQTSIGYAGIIVTAFALPYGAVQILLGPVGDKFGKLRVIAGSLALSTIFVLGSGTADSIEYLATMRFFSGLSKLDFARYDRHLEYIWSNLGGTLSPQDRRSFQDST